MFPLINAAAFISLPCQSDAAFIRGRLLLEEIQHLCCTCMYDTDHKICVKILYGDKYKKVKLKKIGCLIFPGGMLIWAFYKRMKKFSKILRFSTCK